MSYSMNIIHISAFIHVHCVYFRFWEATREYKKTILDPEIALRKNMTLGKQL